MKTNKMYSFKSNRCIFFRFTLIYKFEYVDLIWHKDQI